MFQFIGYDFFSGAGALRSAPGNVDNITTTRLTNAIFDHFNITRDTSLEFNTNKPDQWTFDTVLDAGLNGNLNAGNLDAAVEQIESIKVKRRIKGEFGWITLETIPINGDKNNLVFTVIDRLNTYGTEYEYAFVPVTGNVEGAYIINSILSQFNGVFIGDANQTFRFLYDVNYGTNARNQQNGLFTPLGKQFPIIIANGLLSYDSGTVSGSILNDDFEKTGLLDVLQITQKKEILKDFLTNKKAKMLKDWSGNSWICMIVDSPQISYKSNSGMRVPSVQFNWVQIGDSNNQLDLYNAGLIDEVN